MCIRDSGGGTTVDRPSSLFELGEWLFNYDPIVAENILDVYKRQGEAYALRGLAYLQFAWCWGGAPLITKEISRVEVYKVARSSQEDTYKQAISDFEDAFNRLPDSWASSEAGQIGRAHV